MKKEYKICKLNEENKVKYCIYFCGKWGDSYTGQMYYTLEEAEKRLKSLHG